MVMKDVRDATARILDSTTLADVLKRVETTVSGASQRPHKLPAEFA
jgi:DNA-binding IscR family transcriptional regulator